METFCSTAVLDALRSVPRQSPYSPDLLSTLFLPPPTYALRFNLTRNGTETGTGLPPSLPGLSFASPGYLINHLQIPITISPPFPLLDRRIFCDKFAAEAVLMGAQLFVPGIKHIGSRFRVGDPVSILLDPSAYPAFLSPTETQTQSFQQQFHVANGIAQVASHDLPQMRKGVVIGAIHSRFQVLSYRESIAYQQGLVTDQSFPANYACFLLMSHLLTTSDPHATVPQILDLCAAPGHKTTALAEWGHFLSARHASPIWYPITAVDRSPTRMQHLSADIQRLQLQGITGLACHLERLLDRYPHLRASGDYVMFDPPCSALGTRPKLFINKSAQELANFVANQRRLFKIIDPLVKPGGYLMYNTCTILPAENEGLVAYACDKFGYRVHTAKHLSSPVLPGGPGLVFDTFPPEHCDRVIRFDPGRDGMGYFIALLQKPH